MPGFLIENAVFPCCPGGGTITNRLATPILVFTGVSSTAFTTDWQDVANADSYDIDIATDAQFSNIVDSATGLTSSTYSTSGRIASTAYYVRVIAHDSTAVYSDSDYGMSNTTTASGLVAPTGLQSQHSATTARLYWTAPANTIDTVLEVSSSPSYPGGSGYNFTIQTGSGPFEYDIDTLPIGILLYWRVKSQSPGMPDGPYANGTFTTFNTRLRVSVSNPAPSAGGLGVTFTSATGVNAFEELHFNSIASGSQTGNSSDTDIIVTGVTPSPEALATVDNAYLTQNFAFQDKNAVMHYGNLVSGAIVRSKFVNGTYTFA